MKEGENRALGIIETEGRAPLIEAVDSAIKAAAVTLKSSYFVGGGVNTVTLTGDVGAMRAALDAAKATLQRMGVVGQTHLIPRLAEDVWPLVMDQTNGRGPPPGAPGPEKPKTGAKRDAALPGKAPVQPKADAPAKTDAPPAQPKADVPAEIDAPPARPKADALTETDALPAQPKADTPAELVVPPAPVPDEQPASAPSPEEASGKRGGDAEPGAPEKTLFPDGPDQTGQKVSAPKKKSGDSSSRKNPGKRNPKG